MPARRVDHVPRHLARYTKPPTITPPSTPEPILAGSAGGDAHQLRGIPAIGRNVTGAIPGTSPHHTIR